MTTINALIIILVIYIFCLNIYNIGFRMGYTHRTLEYEFQDFSNNEDINTRINEYILNNVTDELDIKEAVNITRSLVRNM